MSITAPASQIKDTLITRFTQELDLGDVDVSWAPPAEVGREVIYFAGSVSTVDVNVLGSDRTFDDQIVFTLVVDSRVPGRTDEDADRASSDLFSVIRGKLFDPIEVSTLLGTVGSAEVQSISATSGMTPDVEGWTGVIVAQVTYEVLLDN